MAMFVWSLTSFRYLLAVILVGGRKVDGCKPTLRVASSMKLESVVLTLPVLAEGGYASRYLVTVGSDEFADREHG